MRIARYGVAQDGARGRPGGSGGGVTYGVVQGEGSGAIVTAIEGHPFATPALTDDRRALEDVQLLAPFIPSKVVAIGRNYAAHAREMGGELSGQPVVFLKPSTAVIGPGDPILLPGDSERVDYEGELAVVIGNVCRDVPAERAREVILGFTCANDVTARDQQRADGQWTRGKSHDTFCPLGPWVETEFDPADVRLRTVLDGELKQDARTSLMLRNVAELIAFVSSFMTLLPGDVLLTGTPEGVGPMRAGSTVEVTIDGIGGLRNPVVGR